MGGFLGCWVMCGFFVFEMVARLAWCLFGLVGYGDWGERGIWIVLRGKRGMVCLGF